MSGHAVRGRNHDKAVGRTAHCHCGRGWTNDGQTGGKGAVETGSAARAVMIAMQEKLTLRAGGMRHGLVTGRLVACFCCMTGGRHVNALRKRTVCRPRYGQGNQNKTGDQRTHDGVCSIFPGGCHLAMPSPMTRTKPLVRLRAGRPRSSAG